MLGAGAAYLLLSGEPEPDPGTPILDPPSPSDYDPGDDSGLEPLN